MLNYELYKDEHKNKSLMFALHTSDMKTYVQILASGIFRQTLACLKFPSSVNTEHPRNLPGLCSPFKVKNSSLSYFGSRFEKRLEQLHRSVGCPHGSSLE